MRETWIPMVVSCLFLKGISSFWGVFQSSDSIRFGDVFILKPQGWQMDRSQLIAQDGEWLSKPNLHGEDIDLDKWAEPKKGRKKKTRKKHDIMIHGGSFMFRIVSIFSVFWDVFVFPETID